jgi:hypothetical protein
MSLSKKVYEKIKYEEQKNTHTENEWLDKILYTKDKVKKSSLKIGDGFGFDNQRLSSK